MDLDVGFLLALCGLRGCGGGWLVVDGGGCSCGDDDTCAFHTRTSFLRQWC